jgi:hypothetical protein
VADPAKRLTIADLRADPWFTEGYVRASGEESAIEVSTGDIESAFTATAGLEENGGAAAGATSSGSSGSSSSSASSSAAAAAGDGGAPKPVGPVTMNAFDLISLSGALDLTRMLQSKMTIQRATRFVVEKSPAEIMRVLEENLKDMKLHYQAVPQAYKLKVSTERVSFQVQILQLAPTLHIVDFRRGKGDTLAYQSTYREIYERVAAELGANPAPAQPAPGK